jgi:hypothetical protein
MLFIVLNNEAMTLMRFSIILTSNWTACCWSCKSSHWMLSPPHKFTQQLWCLRQGFKTYRMRDMLSIQSFTKSGQLLLIILLSVVEEAVYDLVTLTVTVPISNVFYAHKVQTFHRNHEKRPLFLDMKLAFSEYKWKSSFSIHHCILD